MKIRFIFLINEVMYIYIFYFLPFHILVIVISILFNCSYSLRNIISIKKYRRWDHTVFCKTFSLINCSSEYFYIIWSMQNLFSKKHKILIIYDDSEIKSCVIHVAHMKSLNHSNKHFNSVLQMFSTISGY